MQKIFKDIQARAIGLSNFEVKHLEDIFEMGELLPAVNQFEIHGYWHEFDLIEYCQERNITVSFCGALLFVCVHVCDACAVCDGGRKKTVTVWSSPCFFLCLSANMQGGLGQGGVGCNLLLVILWVCVAWQRHKYASNMGMAAPGEYNMSFSVLVVNFSVLDQ